MHISVNLIFFLIATLTFIHVEAVRSHRDQDGRTQNEPVHAAAKSERKHLKDEDKISVQENHHLVTLVSGLSVEEKEACTKRLEKMIWEANDGGISSKDTARGRKHKGKNKVKASMKMKMDFGNHTIFCVVCDKAMTKEILKDADVSSIEPDGIARPTASDCSLTHNVEKRGMWGLDRIDQSSPLTASDSSNNKFAPTGEQGQGVYIYVLDTGCQVNHEEFEGRAQHAASFPSNIGSNDALGHGTHVAGIAAAKTYGVAKQANIMCVKVLRDQGYGYWSDIIDGILYAKNEIKAKGKGVINLSLGGSRVNAVNAAVNGAVEEGVMVISAAGNDANDACDTSPASAEKGIAVGSTDDSDELSSFSNFGPCVSIYAPGSGIKSSESSRRSNTATGTLSGTSMASPFVAGTIALYLSTPGVDRSPPAILNWLKQRATPNVIKDLDKANRKVCTSAASQQKEIPGRIQVRRRKRPKKPKKPTKPPPPPPPAPTEPPPAKATETPPAPATETPPAPPTETPPAPPTSNDPCPNLLLYAGC